MNHKFNKKNRKLKKAYVLIIIFVIVLIGFSIFYLKANKSKIKEVYGTDSLIVSANNYNINARFPVTNNKELNTKIRSMINYEREVFENEIDKYATEDFKYELNISYKLFQNNNLISIKFNIFEFTGLAHPAEREIVYYYDQELDKEVTWEELFINKDELLNKLSDMTYTKLKNKKDLILLSDLEVKEGLEPTKENYHLIVFDNDKIILTLMPYQVSPYSTGKIEIEFEYKELNKNLNYKGGNQKIIETEKPPAHISDSDRKLRNIENLKNKKIIMITFDDGPAGSVTTKLLNELAKRDAKVTFFVLGERIELYPNIVKKAYKDGHTVANHTYSHKDLKNLSDKYILSEIKKTDKLIFNTIGITNRYVRPPYGSSNKHVFEISNKSFIFWNVDPEDWKYKNADTVYNNIMKGAKDGAIVLVHDLYKTSVDGTLKAIDELLKQGYAIISLEEAEKLGYVNIKINKKYYSLK